MLLTLFKQHIFTNLRRFMADSIEEKMKYLSKRYGFLNRGKGGVIWDKLNSVLESFLSGNTLVAYSDFYNLFQENISEMRKCPIHSEKVVHVPLFRNKDNTILLKKRLFLKEFDNFSQIR